MLVQQTSVVIDPIRHNQMQVTFCNSSWLSISKIVGIYTENNHHAYDILYFKTKTFRQLN